MVAKLNATKQTGDIEKFTEKIEQLTLELERAYLNENVPVITAERLSVKAGIKALTSGIKSEETKLTLKAGQCNTIASAVEKITENDTPTNKIFLARSTNSGNSRYQNYGNRHFRGNGRGNFRGNVNNRGRGNNNYQQNYQRNNYQNRGNYRGRYNNNNNQSRVYYNQQVPLGFQQPQQQAQQQEQQQQQQQLP